MTREEAWNLLTEYNKDAFHLEHAQIVENTMRYFARERAMARKKNSGESSDFCMILISSNFQKNIV